MKSTTRKFVGLCHSIRSDAILLNVILSFHLDLDKQTYIVLEQKTLTDLASADDSSQGGAFDEDDGGDFSPSEKYGKKPIHFPDGVKLMGVLKQNSNRQNTGSIDVFFFPNGYNEAAIFYIGRQGDTDPTYSLLLAPNTGKIDILRGLIQSFDSVISE